MLFAGLSNITKRKPAQISRSSGRCKSPGNKWKRLFFLTVICTIFILSLWLLGFKHNNHNNLIGHSNFKNAPLDDWNNIIYLDYGSKSGDSAYNNFMASYVNMKSCPACFSKSKCSNLMTGGISINESMKLQNHNLHWLSGLFKGKEKIQVGYVDLREWKIFEDAVCRNASLISHQCELLVDLRKSILSNPGFLSTENLLNLHQFVKKTKNELPFLICATSKMVDQLKSAFDEDDDNTLSSDEQIVMLTSLLLHPDYALTKFKMHNKLNVPIPNVLGSCGRIVVRESDWSPISNQLNEPFEVRAGIALQILQLVEDLQEEDSEWYFLNTDFTYENLMQTKDGEIILINLQDMAVIDKSIFPKRVNSVLLEGEICNELCFHKFSWDIVQSSQLICPQISKYGNLMQALVCQQILSDLDEHKSNVYGKLTENLGTAIRQHKGLLHSVPEPDHDTIEDLLRECVQETNVGGRKQAVEELRDLLEKYLNYEDKEDGKTNNENVDPTQ